MQSWKVIFRPICLVIGCKPKFIWKKTEAQGRIICGRCGADEK